MPENDRFEMKGSIFMSETNHCIKCDAKNCVYHSESNYCTADGIKVGYTDAHNCCDTACTTFENKVEQTSANS